MEKWTLTSVTTGAVTAAAVNLPHEEASSKQMTLGGFLSPRQITGSVSCPRVGEDEVLITLQSQEQT